VRDALPPGAALVDLGERRLKDLPGTERVYQLAAPGLLDAFPPLKTLDARPHDLPAAPSPLVGREADITAVRDLIRDGGARLVTLTGPGGIGKTRLAMAAAERLVDAFADGVRWLPLASLAEPRLIVPAVAARLGVREEPGHPLDETLLAWLRERELLLVLDNCEHVLDAVAEAVAAWLEAAPGLKVVATSRGRLRLRAERAVAIQPLALPPAGRRPWPRLRRHRPARWRSSGRQRWPTRRSPTPTPRRWPGSAPCSTACRWRSSWRRPGSTASPRPRC
jgi:hypothetical protein